MKVILCKELPKLGKAGDIVKVKDGYARNYLIPGGLVLEATEANVKRVELTKTKRLEELEKKKQELKEMAEKLSGVSVNIEAEATEDDKLYGAISASQIHFALKEEGFSVAEENIVLDESIKKLGIYDVKVKLAQDIEAEIKVWVVRK